MGINPEVSFCYSQQNSDNFVMSFYPFSIQRNFYVDTHNHLYMNIIIDLQTVTSLSSVHHKDYVAPIFQEGQNLFNLELSIEILAFNWSRKLVFITRGNP